MGECSPNGKLTRSGCVGVGGSISLGRVFVGEVEVV